MKNPQIYRDMIDELVRMCQEGQGRMGADNIRNGIHKQDSSVGFDSDELATHLLLSKLSDDEREIIAKFSLEGVVTGVFETLKALETYGIPPFEDGYEGSPFNDFIGRMDGWEWPE